MWLRSLKDAAMPVPRAQQWQPGDPAPQATPGCCTPLHAWRLGPWRRRPPGRHARAPPRCPHPSRMPWQRWVVCFLPLPHVDHHPARKGSWQMMSIANCRYMLPIHSPYRVGLQCRGELAKVCTPVVGPTNSPSAKGACIASCEVAAAGKDAVGQRLCVAWGGCPVGLAACSRPNGRPRLGWRARCRPRPCASCSAACKAGWEQHGDVAAQ